MKCAYIKTNGQQCKANAMQDSGYCFTHNPETRHQHALAVVRGGKAIKKQELHLEPVEVKSSDQVVNLLQETINGIRDGSIPGNIANTIGYLCGHLLKAIEASNLNDRIEIIESVLFQRKITKKK